MTVLPRGVGFVTTPVGYDSVTLGFGRLAIAFRGIDDTVRFSIDETHVPFVIRSDLPADLELECRVGTIHPPVGPVTFSAGDAWDLRREPDGSEDMLIRGGATPVWHLRIDRNFERGSLVEAPVMPDRRVRADGYPLLEYLVARLIARHQGLLIHASTAIVDGAAYVFVGHSGAGKSTMASLGEVAGARIPTDDRTIITVEDGDVMAWGTPWHGSLVRKSPEGAPIRRIFLLQQSDGDRVELMLPSRAVKELFVRLIQPRLHPVELHETLRLLEQVVERVPVAVLHFRPTPAAFALAVG